MLLQGQLSQGGLDLLHAAQHEVAHDVKAETIHLDTPTLLSCSHDWSCLLMEIRTSVHMTQNVCYRALLLT